MAEQKILVCDVCQQPATSAWQVTTPRHKTVGIDLCADHAADLEALAKRGTPLATARGRLTRHQDLRVVPS